MFGLPSHPPALLPSAYVDREQIQYMEPGEVKWTLPWSMYVNFDMECFLNGTYMTKDWPGGTVEMQIERTAEGFFVCLVPSHKYSAQKRPPWVGSADATMIPVLGFR